MEIQILCITKIALWGGETDGGDRPQRGFIKRLQRDTGRHREIIVKDIEKAKLMVIEGGVICEMVCKLIYID